MKVQTNSLRNYLGSGLALLLATLMNFANGAATPPSVNYQISASVMGSGGVYQQSAHYGLNSTSGQPSPVGVSASTAFNYASGFWHDYSPSFAAVNFALSVTNQNSQGGTVASNSGGINCGLVCNQEFVLNTVVTLTATPQTGYSFAGWTGDCTGTALTCSLTMAKAHSLTVNFAANQTISFASAPVVVVGGTGTVSATGGGSGNPVIFSSTTTGVCSVNGSTVTGLSAGTCIIAADQAGNANYNAAPEATQTITIGKGSQTLSFGAAPSIGIGGSGTVSATGGATGNPVIFGSMTPSVCSVSGNFGSVVTAVAAGTCTIVADEAGDTNYNDATPAKLSFTIAKANQVIMFGATPLVTVGNCATVTAIGGASGNPVVFSASSSQTPTCVTTGSNGSTVCGLKTGPCTLIANQAGNANYNAAPQVTQTFSVIPGLALTVSNANATFGNVISNVGGINCGANCSASFPSGSLVTLTAIPVSGYQFTGWGGACSGYGNSCTVTMSTAQTVTAKFAVFKIHQPVWKRMIKSITQGGG